MDHALVNHVDFGFVSKNGLQHGLHCKADFVGDVFDFSLHVGLVTCTIPVMLLILFDSAKSPSVC